MRRTQPLTIPTPAMVSGRLAGTIQYSIISALLVFLLQAALPMHAAAQSSELPVTFKGEVFRIETPLPVSGAALPASQDRAAELPASGILATVWITPLKGYHFYANDPGDTGRPTELIPDSLQQDMTILYPEGIAAKDVFDPTATVMIHEEATPFFIHLPTYDAKGALPITVRLLLCSDSNCLPVQKKLTIEWDDSTTALATAESQPWWPTLAQYKAVTATAGGQTASDETENATGLAKELGVALPSASGTSPLGSSAAESGTLQTPAQTGNAVTAVPLKNSLSAPDGSPFFSETKGYALSPRYHLQSLEVTTLGTAIAFGLLAGFILNFMPCVLPVISLKLSSLVSASGIIDERKRMASFREHNIWFAMGIMVWFLMLATIFSAAGTAWGQLFQDERLVTGLMLLMFALGLSTFGIFELPMLNLHGSASQENGKWSAFSTGLLATLLATPCSGPFLGGVLGWAFLQPPLVVATILLAVGTGMAIPYAGMAIFPSLVRHFPKPGSWTLVLQRLVGFFLMGTTGYLLTILPAEKLPFLLAVLWVTAVAAWVWGNFADFNAPRLQRILIRPLCVALIAIPLAYGNTPTATVKPWKPFTQQSFLAALGNENIMIDFTADWCPNCKILEHTVLTANNRARWAEKYDITYIKVDLTRPNEKGQSLLNALGSQSIPVVALFPKGGRAGEPVVLRDLFTTELADSALEDAFGEN
ncbi:thioredoxin domain-containing protein [Desulfovibrio mangrovi]|uniref:cytochrome c biogenesis protein CcdA n=1 Tax=Desulfovibrio mangrovi TaxID=2976983 RepID=UPI0022456791|nr:cytochrome c biogenesis protein CcdA [Desulfovibrio mangrovi]UZP67458.1 thioredoxin domain-containing protein [Desulfovibrio mangrovi]